MKKTTLAFFLMLGFSIALNGTASAQIAGCEIIVNDPLVNSYETDPIFVSWEAQGCQSGVFYLEYQVGSCEDSERWEPIDSTREQSFEWDSEFNEAEVCIRVLLGDSGGARGVMDGTFFIDNIVPEANAGESYVCNEGETVMLDASILFNLRQI